MSIGLSKFNKDCSSERDMCRTKDTQPVYYIIICMLAYILLQNIVKLNKYDLVWHEHFLSTIIASAKYAILPLICILLSKWKKWVILLPFVYYALNIIYTICALVLAKDIVLFLFSSLALCASMNLVLILYSYYFNKNSANCNWLSKYVTITEKLPKIWLIYLFLTNGIMIFIAPDAYALLMLFISCYALKQHISKNQNEPSSTIGIYTKAIYNSKEADLIQTIYRNNLKCIPDADSSEVEKIIAQFTTKPTNENLRKIELEYPINIIKQVTIELYKYMNNIDEPMDYVKLSDKEEQYLLNICVQEFQKDVSKADSPNYAQESILQYFKQPTMKNYSNIEIEFDIDIIKKVAIFMYKKKLEILKSNKKDKIMQILMYVHARLCPILNYGFYVTSDKFTLCSPKILSFDVSSMNKNDYLTIYNEVIRECMKHMNKENKSLFKYRICDIETDMENFISIYLNNLNSKEKQLLKDTKIDYGQVVNPYLICERIDLQTRNLYSLCVGSIKIFLINNKYKIKIGWNRISSISSIIPLCIIIALRLRLIEMRIPENEISEVYRTGFSN